MVRWPWKSRQRLEATYYQDNLNRHLPRKTENSRHRSVLSPFPGARLVSPNTTNIGFVSCSEGNVTLGLRNLNLTKKNHPHSSEIAREMNIWMQFVSLFFSTV